MEWADGKQENQSHTEDGLSRKTNHTQRTESKQRLQLWGRSRGTVTDGKYDSREVFKMEASSPELRLVLPCESH